MKKKKNSNGRKYLIFLIKYSIFINNCVTDTII